MILHVWSVVCTKAVIDSETNNLTLSELIEQVDAVAIKDDALPSGAMPLLPMRLEVVNFWTREPLDTPLQGVGRISLSLPNTADQVIGREFDIDLSSATRARTILRLPGIPVTQSGRYWVIVELRHNDEWNPVAKVPIDMTIQFVKESDLESAAST